MRLALLGLVAPLFALPLFAQTTDVFSHVSQASVTLATTYSRPGDFAKTAKKRSDDDYNVSFPISTIRFGNSQLLDILVEEAVIPEKKGWALVVVWADWESNGASSYRFFVRKKAGGAYLIERVPPALLGIEMLQPYLAKTVKTKVDSGEIISGNDNYKAYTRLLLGADPRESEDATDPAERRITASTPLGMIGGTGRYVRPSGADAAFYLPNTITFTGYAISEAYESGDSDVVVANLKFAKSSAVPSTRYSEFFTGENPSRGPDSVAVVLP